MTSTRAPDDRIDDGIHDWDAATSDGDANLAGRVVVVMGVSGSGKTTIAVALAQRLGVPFTEGDDLHPAANVEKMRSGTPLTDEDRWPWLDKVAALLKRAGEVDGAVVTCSALRRAYRDVLAAAGDVFFVQLDVPAEVLAERLAKRKGHFMPASLLASQLATLEPLQPDEIGVVVSGTGSPEESVQAALAALGAHASGR